MQMQGCHAARGKHSKPCKHVESTVKESVLLLKGHRLDSCQRQWAQVLK